MTRLLFLLLLTVSLLGCQSMPSEQGKTVLAESRTPDPTLQHLWSKTARLLHPILPDDSEERRPIQGQAPMSAQYMPISRPEYSAAYPAVGFSEEFTGASAKPTANKLYRPGSIFPSPVLLDEESPDEIVNATDATPKKPVQKGNVLQAKSGDSEQFQQLLKLIEQTPRDQRGVTDGELARLLTNFREDMLEDDARDLEANYLVHLRKKILPDYKPPKKTAAPLPEEEFGDDEEQVARSVPKRQAERSEKTTRSSRRYRSEVDDEEDRYAADTVDEDDDDELARREAMALKSRRKPRNPAPMPLPIPMAVPMEGAAHTPAPQPPVTPPTQPIYPGLTQLDGTAPPVVTAQQQAPVGNVVPVNYVAPAPPQAVQGSWEHHSRLAAQLLRQQMDGSSSARSFSNEARLRLLELVNGNRVEAVRPFSEVEKPFNDFWGNQILGFSALMDDLGHPDVKARHINAAFRFDEGLMDLRRLCPIRLRNVRLARDVWAFGDFLPRGSDCQAGEKVEVYIELENPTIRRTGEGFSVNTSISYEIRDNAGNVIDKHTVIDKNGNTSIQSTSPSRRRDYYVHLKMAIPDNLAPGSYHLRVSVTDLNDEAMPFAEEQIPLTVTPDTVPEKRVRE